MLSNNPYLYENIKWQDHLPQLLPQMTNMLCVNHTICLITPLFLWKTRLWEQRVRRTTTVKNHATVKSEKDQWNKLLFRVFQIFTFIANAESNSGQGDFSSFSTVLAHSVQNCWWRQSHLTRISHKKSLFNDSCHAMCCLWHAFHANVMLFLDEATWWSCLMKLPDTVIEANEIQEIRSLLLPFCADKESSTKSLQG